ncbi:ABC transporter permease [Kitasatospora atroaurantiaca]|uniref:FtsX-like permease family protein n=1 Tax=Kitasatospora atroaurantiaca TaxID=285545 RepID=A0A561ERS3_9ACTN|nr:FtsX-like permease family protein [Kitasatospora atroaurantiaca]TWE18313.1 FtsX-like permease family protein [Kitasatospora atroaurantiaca]
MIRFALRLTLSGGKEALARLVIIAAAVAIGVGLLLSTLASINAVDRTNSRQLWLNSGSVTNTATAPVDPMLWRYHRDYFDGREITSVDVAPTGPTAPIPPGLAKLPAPDEYYASPALAKLIRSTPADQLGDRFPRTLAGEIGSAALPSPDSLIAVIGRTPDQLSTLPEVSRVTAIATTFPGISCSDCPGNGVRGDAMTLILSVVAGALIFPVAIFIGTATRLSAARREQRYAAMRLVGATPGQVSLISAVESTLAATVGAVVGFGLFLLLRPVVATVPFTGDRFFAGDLTLTAGQVTAVALGVPVAAAVAARLALRRVTISPLGVARRVTPRPPRAWRLLPLLAGIGELAYFVGRRPETTAGQTQAYLTGFLLVMAGLVTAGPWITMSAARAVALRTGRPATLIAVRRLADDPKAGFRSVSGLVLALFVTSATVGIIGTINVNRGALSGDPGTRSSVVHGGWIEDPPLADALPERLMTEMHAIPGVKSVTVVHANPAGIGADQDPRGQAPALVLCSDLARTAVLGHCPAGAGVAAVPLYRFYDLRSASDAQWPTVPISAEELAHLPVRLTYTTTDGSTAAMEQARTLMTRAYPRYPSRMVLDRGSSLQQQLAGWRQLANVVILTTLPIAGCSLAVSVVAGLSDRKRPFAMLRLTGVPLGMLRRVIGLESALPLLSVAVVATGTGFLAAHLFLKSQMHYDLVSPGAVYFVLVAGGIVASLGIIASTLPLLKRLTGPETARNG